MDARKDWRGARVCGVEMEFGCAGIMIGVKCETEK
jgi:hypothetical protein